MAWADSEAKFLIIRTLLGAAEAGFFPGMIYLTSQWFPQRNRASIMGLFYMGAPLALTLGSPLSGALLEMHGFYGAPGMVLDVRYRRPTGDWRRDIHLFLA
ncbi:4-hydroxyphenylacetate permease [Salmonella enterica subsp. enterica]|uniref:4-hydroxyphenylacetate permease n=1 Tax=Salmonella enterica I TaxID=59201 RepID=A0A3S4HUA4_SALET|nr:4-hydroxyphenylacetate permease [Salmonella enterica subsp. enterica]